MLSAPWRVGSMFADAVLLEETTRPVVDESRMKVVRTGIVAGVSAAIVLGGFWYLSIDQKQRQIEALEARNDAFQATIQQREELLDRLTCSRRSGLLEVLEQTTDPSGSHFTTTVRFVELDGEGRSIGSQECTVNGNVIFIDGLVVKFDHATVAGGEWGWVWKGPTRRGPPCRAGRGGGWGGAALG